MTADATDRLALVRYRCEVAGLYHNVRNDGGGVTAWKRWRSGRDRLFAGNEHSPVLGRPEASTGMAFFDYDPTWALTGTIEDTTSVRTEPLQVEGQHQPEVFDPIGAVRFERLGRRFSLPIYWSRSYSGGLFLPFRDETNGGPTAGTGRYLLDGAKSAHLGTVGDELVLDFNFAYHPSCVWGAWVCPLAVSTAKLPVRVEAGERCQTAQQHPKEAGALR